MSDMVITDRRHAARLADLQLRPVETPAAFPAALQPLPAGLVSKKTEKQDDPGKITLAAALNNAQIYLRWAGTLHHKSDSDAPPYLGWGCDAALTVATLWAAHACARLRCSDAKHGHGPSAPGKMIWPATPRLGIFASPPPEDADSGRVGEGSGKNYLAELLMDLVPSPVMEVQPTGPALARIFGLEHATLFLDEGKDFFGQGNRHMMAKNLLENGYRPRGTSSRVYGNVRHSFSTFAPVCLLALSSIEIETGADLVPFLSRFAAIIRLQQAPRGYRPPRIRQVDRDDLKGVTEDLQQTMGEALSRFLELMDSDDGSASLRKLTSYMTPRQAEIWEPLLVIAAVADSTEPDQEARHWLRDAVVAADWYCNRGAERAAAQVAQAGTRAAVTRWAAES